MFRKHKFVQLYNEVADLYYIVALNTGQNIDFSRHKFPYLPTLNRAEIRRLVNNSWNLEST